MNATTTKGSGRWPTANCQDVTLLFLHRTLPRMIWRFPLPRGISKKCWYVIVFLASLSRSCIMLTINLDVPLLTIVEQLYFLLITSKLRWRLLFYFVFNQKSFLKIQIQAMDLDCDTIFVKVYDFDRISRISLVPPVLRWFSRKKKRKKSFEQFLQGYV